MQLVIKPGKYVVAVSGGVDSMVLLDLLAQLQPDRSSYAFVVAHYDHGIRPDSGEDRELVRQATERYGLPFVTEEGNLAPNTSEAAARRARYDFLKRVMNKEQASGGIVTAHHQDDVLETAVINMLRGTGRLGLSSLRSRDKLLRPLLDYTKEEIYRYATDNGLQWREDSTNADDKYLRNYVRIHILTRFGDTGRAMLLDRIRHAQTINDQIDALLSKDLDLQPAVDQLKRSWFVKLPYAVAREVMATWLRRNGILEFNRQLIKRLVEFSLTKAPGKLADVDAKHMLAFDKDSVRLIDRPSENVATKPKKTKQSR